MFIKCLGYINRQVYDAAIYPSPQRRGNSQELGSLTRIPPQSLPWDQWGRRPCLPSRREKDMPSIEENAVEPAFA